MTKKELNIIIERIRERKPYVDIYYKQFGYKPQWLKREEPIIPDIRNKYKEELIDFEEWLVWYKREERINGILGE
jgi:hypothetical protein